jgi:hypothetical protein
VLTTFDGEVIEIGADGVVEIGGWGFLGKAVSAVTHPARTIKAVASRVTHPKKLLGDIKSVADTAASVVKNKYVAGTVMAVATATGVGAPVAGAYAAALVAVNSYESGKTYVDAAAKVAKAAGILKGDSKAVAAAKMAKAPAAVKAGAALVAANAKKLEPFKKTLKLAANLKGMAVYGQPGQKAKAVRNATVLKLVEKENAARAKLVGGDAKKAKLLGGKLVAAATKAVNDPKLGLVITLDGKLLKGKFHADLDGKLRGFLVQNGRASEGIFSVGDEVGREAPANGPQQWLGRFIKSSGHFDRPRFVHWLKLTSSKVDPQTAARMLSYANHVSVGGSLV